MNTFTILPIDEEIEEITIKNDNQCRNKKKLLQRKIEKYDKDPSPELLKIIKILKCAIHEYKTKDIVYEKVSKKESSKSKNDDSKLLNQLSKKNRKLRFKQRMRDQEIDKLWKKSNGYPKWTPTVHKLFPSYDRKCIELLLLAKNNENCIFSILPDEVINNILSNVRWDWFYVEGNQREVLHLHGNDKQILEKYFVIKSSDRRYRGR